MRTLAVCVAVLALVAGAQGQDLKFPYYRCQAGKSKSGINVADTITRRAGNTYCFQIEKSPCTGGIDPNGGCCKMDASKFELDADPTCNLGNTQISATLGGDGELARILFVPPENSGDVGANNLRIRFSETHDRDFFAGGRELCITLSGSCGTLPRLCRGGQCNVSVTGSSHVCCPVTHFPMSPPPSPPPPSPPPPSPPPPSPSPPPPPPPPSPRPPSPRPPSPHPPPPPSPPPPSPPPPSPPPPPPPSCPVCFDLSLEKLAADPTYKFPPATCDSMASVISKGVADAAAQSGASILSPFTMVNECSDTKISVCGVIATEADGQLLQTVITNELLAEWLLVILGGGCTPPMIDHTFSLRIAADDPGCLQGGATLACARPPPPPWPKRQCIKSQGASRFTVSAELTSEPGSLPSSTWYCMAVTTADADPRFEKCSATTVLAKMEIYADDQKRRSVIAMKIKYNDGSSSLRSVSWDAIGRNALKINGLNWTAEDVAALAPQVCFELKDLTAEEFCLGNGPGYCWAALFDPTHDCCPVYGAFQ